MKAKLFRDELITHPDLKSHDDIKALEHEIHSGQIGVEEYNRRRRAAVKAGTVIDHPQAWQLVAMGIAEPVDQECVNRAALAMPGAISLDAKIANAVEGMERLESGQVTGDPKVDATDAQAEQLKAAKVAQLAQAG